MRVVDTNSFIKMIANKRVALIGPAEYVCKELGEEHGKHLATRFKNQPAGSQDRK